VLLAAVAAVLSGVMSWFQIEAQIQPRDDEGTASAAA
jgi:hypothetical protein